MIRPYQIRAGRALLGWSADELAKRSGLSSASVRRAEDKPAAVKTDNLIAIIETFRAAGVRLVRQGDSFGVVLEERR